MRTAQALLMSVSSLVACALAAGCLADDGDVELDTVAQAAGALPGTKLQGTKLQAASINGTKLQGTKLQSATLGGAAVVNARVVKTSIEGFTWNSSGGYWEYRYGSAHLRYINGGWTGPYRGGIVGMGIPTTLPGGAAGPTLRILGVKADQSTNYRADGSNSNADLLVITARLEQNGINYNPCTGQPDGTSCEGFFIDGTWDANETFSPGTGVTFVAHEGVGGKCVWWGFRPWENVTKPYGTVPLRALYASCVRAAKADVCGDGVSGTLDGTVVDLWDVFGILVPQLPENQLPFYIEEADKTFHGSTFEGMYRETGAMYMEHNRWDRLDAEYDPACSPATLVDLETKQYTWHTFEPSYALANGLFLIGVETTTWCEHSPLDVSPGWGQGQVYHLEKDCNTCTKTVCSTPGYGDCCVQGNAWNATCAALAQGLPECQGQ